MPWIHILSPKKKKKNCWKLFAFLHKVVFCEGICYESMIKSGTTKCHCVCPSTLWLHEFCHCQSLTGLHWSSYFLFIFNQKAGETLLFNRWVFAHSLAPTEPALIHNGSTSANYPCATPHTTAWVVYLYRAPKWKKRARVKEKAKLEHHLWLPSTPHVTTLPLHPCFIFLFKPSNFYGWKNQREISEEMVQMAAKTAPMIVMRNLWRNNASEASIFIYFCTKLQSKPRLLRCWGKSATDLPLRCF